MVLRLIRGKVHEDIGINCLADVVDAVVVDAAVVDAVEQIEGAGREADHAIGLTGAYNQSRRLKMKYRLTQTTAIRPIAKG